MRTFLVLVLSITALAAAGLWVYSRERTIDASYSAASINRMWPVRAMGQALDISADKFRVVVIRGSLHILIDGKIIVAGEHEREGSLGGRPMSFDFRIRGPVVVSQTGRQVKVRPDDPRSYIAHARLELWLALALSALYPVWTLWRRPVRIRSRRTRRGLCGVCGYNLHGNTSGVCPECGQATLLTATA